MLSFFQLFFISNSTLVSSLVSSFHFLSERSFSQSRFTLLFSFNIKISQYLIHTLSFSKLSKINYLSFFQSIYQFTQITFQIFTTHQTHLNHLFLSSPLPSFFIATAYKGVTTNKKPVPSTLSSLNLSNPPAFKISVCLVSPPQKNTLLCKYIYTPCRKFPQTQRFSVPVVFFVVFLKRAKKWTLGV